MSHPSFAAVLGLLSFSTRGTQMQIKALIYQLGISVWDQVYQHWMKGSIFSLLVFVLRTWVTIHCVWAGNAQRIPANTWDPIPEPVFKAWISQILIAKVAASQGKALTVTQSVSFSGKCIFHFPSPFYQWPLCCGSLTLLLSARWQQNMVSDSAGWEDGNKKDSTLHWMFATY